MGLQEQEDTFAETGVRTVTRYRFLDVRKRPHRVLWLEKSSGGLFRIGKGLYTQKVLEMIGVHYSPEVERLEPQRDLLQFAAAPSEEGFTSRTYARKKKSSREKR